MSAAPELPPVVHIPERARRGVAAAPGRRRPVGPDAGTVVAFPGCALPAPAHVAYPVGGRAAPVSAGVARPLGSAAGERMPRTVRLTRRGYAVLALLTVVGAVALVWLARASAPAGGTVTPPPATVTVHDGDTLWGLATRLAPDRDPRDVVAELRRINELDGSVLVPGQVLRTR